MNRIKEIYERHADLVYRTAMVHMKDIHDAEDIVQSIFLTLIDKDIMFENEEHEKRWLIKATGNRCKDVLKSSWRRSTDLEDPEDSVSAINRLSGQASDDDLSDEDTDPETVRTLLMSFPEELREILFLHFYEGYTVNEVAEMLNIKESKVRSGITSARRALRKDPDRKCQQ